MEEGTIVHVDYDLWNAETEDLIETTREAIAEEHGMDTTNRTFQPMVAIVGHGALIEGFEDALLEAEPDKDYSITIEPDKAYGEKDPNEVMTISQDKLMRYVRDPRSLYLGAPITIDGRTGTLSFLAAGRARIDYNHPMAGRTLKYDYRIVKVIDEPDERIAALLTSTTGHEDFDVSTEGEDVVITVPQSMLFDTNASMMKFRSVTTLRDAAKITGDIVFREVHASRKASDDDASEEE